jgi:hypothetical protein
MLAPPVRTVTARMPPPPVRPVATSMTWCERIRALRVLAGPVTKR